MICSYCPLWGSNQAHARLEPTPNILKVKAVARLNKNKSIQARRLQMASGRLSLC